MKKQIKLLPALCLLVSVSCTAAPKEDEPTVELRNPVIPGYYADPSIVEHEGVFYMYATADPWGGEFLSCWVSDDLKNWTFNQLNWPTKAACTSPNSSDSKVWAPSVVKKDGYFYMYISVGSEVWCGSASHPLGPWKNMLGDDVMIPYDLTKFYHVIDAEAFIDDDGRAYLYWGSGWNWTNGHCYVAELNDDMSSFKTEPVEVTPTRYFEGPLMVKYDGLYYLTYSEGVTMDETYEVRYAVGDNPFGPFTEAANSPVLTTNESLNVYGPGHHTVFVHDNKYYIVYHRHRLPFETGTAFRQLCINEMTFDTEKRQINTIVPNTMEFMTNLPDHRIAWIDPVTLTASSESNNYLAEKAMDNDFATRWEASEGDDTPWIMATLKPDTKVEGVSILPEYAWKTYRLKVEVSNDGHSWETISDYTDSGISGSPVISRIDKTITYVRITFNREEEITPSIWDIYFY